MCGPGTSYMAGSWGGKEANISVLDAGVESHQQYYDCNNEKLKLPIQFFTGHLNFPTPIFNQGFLYYVNFAVALLPECKSIPS